jgi:cold shock CspA family protein
MRGVIVAWNRSYGYIRPDHGTDPDVYLSESELPNELKHRPCRGRRVQYETVDDGGGLRATNVRQIR